MLTFYLIAGGLAVLAALAIVRPLIAGRSEADDRDARDAAVFRDQLAEIERDLARGTITPEEAEGARVEVSRRLIAADQRARRADRPRPAPQGQSGLVAGLALVGTPALAVAVYFGLGAPGVSDQPLAGRSGSFAAIDGGTAARPGQEEAEAAVAGQQPARATTPDPEYAAMVERLEAMLAERPDDLQGNRLLASALMNLGRYAEAWRAWDRVIALSGGTADAETRASKAEGMVLAAGGYVSPRAEAEIARALELDPSLPVARYYGGLALRQAGRLDEAIAMWRGLRRDSPADAPYLQWLDMMLAEAVQARGGPAIPGPSREDMAAAENLSPEERAAMIDGMVARLDERLRRQGGTADEWGRLIASYATLGRMEAAADAYDRALAALGDGPDADALRTQAARFGLAGTGAAGPDAGAPARPAAPAAPQAAAGPTGADMAAAAEMSPEDRAAMVDGMVARLEARLTGRGGSADEWLRLIDSYVKLDRPQEAARAYRLAAEALEGDPQAGFVKEQALLMGVPVE